MSWSQCLVVWCGCVTAVVAGRGVISVFVFIIFVVVVVDDAFVVVVIVAVAAAVVSVPEIL